LRAVFLIYLLLPLTAISQEGSVTSESSLSYTYGLDRFSFNLTLEAFNRLDKFDDALVEDDFDLNYLESQFTTIYSLFTDSKLGLSYYYRQLDPFSTERDNQHRIIEQYAFVSYLDARRFSHRLRVEQRFKPGVFENRLRYRFGYDFPLSGADLNPGEPYLVISNEILFSITEGEDSGENRIYIGFGWFFNRKRKLELGPEYRVENIANGDLVHVVNFSTTFYMNK